MIQNHSIRSFLHILAEKITWKAPDSVSQAGQLTEQRDSVLHAASNMADEQERPRADHWLDLKDGGETAYCNSFIGFM